MHISQAVFTINSVSFMLDYSSSLLRPLECMQACLDSVDDEVYCLLSNVHPVTG